MLQTDKQPAPDPKAHQLYDRLFQEFEPQIAILFGSRARGDHHQDSDLDILLVQAAPEPKPENPWLQEETARELADTLYGPEIPPQVQLVKLTPLHFATSLRSVNGVAARAVPEGFIRTQPGIPMPKYDPYQQDGEYYETERLYAVAVGDFKAFTSLVANTCDVEISVGRQLFYAYRNALMHAYSKNRLRYDYTLPLTELASRASDDINAIGQIADSPRLPLLDYYYDRKGVKFVSNNYPDWSQHSEAAQREITILLNNPASDPKTR